MCEAPRALNRAVLARQHLLARTASSDEMIERLVDCRLRRHWGPYVGLWSRLADFVQPNCLRCCAIAAPCAHRSRVPPSISSVLMIRCASARCTRSAWPNRTISNRVPKSCPIPRATAVTHS
jgi:hypothetical protein